MTTARGHRPYDGRRFEIGESLGHQMISVVNMMKREVDSRMVEYDLTDAQWKPLWLIKAGRASTAIELARCMDIDAGAITRMLDRLEAKGLVERARSDEDRRVVKLRLTRAGEAAAEKVPHVLAAVNNDFLRGFSESEWKQLCKFLQRLAANGAAMQAQTAEAAER